MQNFLKILGRKFTYSHLYRNRVPTTSLKGKAPFEFFKHHHLFHILKSWLLILCNKSKSQKINSVQGHFLCVYGYPQTQKGYKLYYLELNSFFVSRDLKFHKKVIPFAIPQQQQPSSPSSIFINHESTYSANLSSDVLSLQKLFIPLVIKMRIFTIMVIGTFLLLFMIKLTTQIILILPTATMNQQQRL